MKFIIFCICFFFVFTKALLLSNSTDCSYFLSPNGIDQKNATEFSSLSFALKQFIANKPNETNPIICLKKGIFKNPDSFTLKIDENSTIANVQSLEIKSVDGTAEIHSDVLIVSDATSKNVFETIVFESVVVGKGASSCTLFSRKLVLRSFEARGSTTLSCETLSMSAVFVTDEAKLRVLPMLQQQVFTMKKLTVDNSTFKSFFSARVSDTTVVDVQSSSFNAGASITSFANCKLGSSSIELRDVSLVASGNATRQLVVGGDCTQNITLSNVHIVTPLAVPMSLLGVNVWLLNVTSDQLRFGFPSGAKHTLVIEDSNLNLFPTSQYGNGFSAPHFTMNGSKMTCDGGYIPFQCAVPPQSDHQHTLSTCATLDASTVITACLSSVCNDFNQYSTKNGLSCVTCDSPKKLNKAKDACIIPEGCSATNKSPDCVDCEDGYFNNKTHACAFCLTTVHQITTPSGCVCDKGYYMHGSFCASCNILAFSASLDGRCEFSTIVPLLIGAGVCCLCALLVFVAGIVMQIRKKRKNDYMMPEMNEPLLR